MSAELQHAASVLERHRPEGPCDDRCGCTSDPATTATSVSLVAKPLGEGEVPIACTLDADAMPGRLEDWRGVLGFVRARTPIEGGLRLELDPSAPLPEIARLAAAEQDCCRFFAFALTIDRRGLALEVRAPDDALAGPARLVRAWRHEEPGHRCRRRRGSDRLRRVLRRADPGLPRCHRTRHGPRCRGLRRPRATARRPRRAGADPRATSSS